MKNLNLDKHWAGFYYCHTCSFYTGQIQFHENHEVEELRDKPYIGAIVVIKTNGMIFPAIVYSIQSDTLIDVEVFGKLRVKAYDSVFYGNPAEKEECWFWPERD